MVDWLCERYVRRRLLIFIKSFLRKAFFVSQKPFFLENIKGTEIAANVGKFLKSPIISQKRDILNLILSDSKTDGKNLCFSITKPFDRLLKTPEINKWCAILCDYRTNDYEEFKEISRKIFLLNDLRDRN